MRKILGLTSIRSEYDLMSGVYRHLHADPEIDLRLLVSGAHLSPAHGYTAQYIARDGLPVLAEVETLISGDTPSSRLKTASNLLSGAIDIVRPFQPDVIVFAGDREDVLVGGMLGGFLGIPTAHFFGGDHAADGHVDNPVRHATSKLASTHFVSMSEHRDRLMRIGESAHRIFVIGSVALDKFIAEPSMPRDLVHEQTGAKPHAAKAPWALLIFHPIDAEIRLASAYVSNAAEALIEEGFHVFIGAPNTDPGNHALANTLRSLGEHDQVTFYRDLSRSLFINLFRQCSLIAGNSSAGILEAATLKLPAINIGLRQRGRACGSNVVFTDGQPEDIRKAISTVRAPAFVRALQDLRNPYGDGRSAETAAALLKSLPFAEFIGKAEDPLHVVE